MNKKPQIIKKNREKNYFEKKNPQHILIRSAPSLLLNYYTTTTTTTTITTTERSLNIFLNVPDFKTNHSSEAHWLLHSTHTYIHTHTLVHTYNITLMCNITKNLYTTLHSLLLMNCCVIKIRERYIYINVYVIVWRYNYYYIICNYFAITRVGL